MRLIHTADLHIDSKMLSNLDSEKARLRRNELLDSFEGMVNYASAHSVSVIMLVGDLFDKPHNRRLARERVLEAIKSHPEIDFLYLKGNHDRTDFIDEMNAENIPGNLKLFSKDEWTSYDYGDVVITGRELTTENARNISANLVLDRTKTNIVMLHGQVSETFQGVTDPIVLPDFRNKNIDYLALGHLHTFRQEKLDDRGIWCYSGCLEGRGFDECGEKGFVVLDASDGKVNTEFVPFSKRVFHEIHAELNANMEMADIIASCEEVLSDIPEKDIVKLVLCGEIKTDFYLDLDRIERTFSERFFFFKVYDETKIFVDYESFIHDRTLKGEFVRLVQGEDLSEEEKGKIIDLGIRAILGEEIEE